MPRVLSAEANYSTHNNGLLVGCIKCNPNPQRHGSRGGICECFLSDALRLSQSWVVESILDVFTDEERGCESEGECLRYILVLCGHGERRDGPAYQRNETKPVVGF